MITLVNFANENFKTQQKWNSITAKLLGKVDEVIEFSLENIEEKFLKENKNLLQFSKGFGNYFWKPYIIKKALANIKKGDYLLYTDSGTIFLKSIKPLVKYMELKEKNIMCFSIPLIEKQWTKRDAFLLMDCDQKRFTETRQIVGTYILMKKCKETDIFVNKYSEYCSDNRILSDLPNTLGMPNYPEFNEHRHDQSVLSLLCKKNNVLIEGDPSDYGVFPHMYLHKESYLYDNNALNPDNNIFKGTLLSNRKVHPLKYVMIYFVRLMLSKLGLNA